jgi:hypothetical protein
MQNPLTGETRLYDDIRKAAAEGLTIPVNDEARRMLPELSEPTRPSQHPSGLNRKQRRARELTNGR